VWDKKLELVIVLKSRSGPSLKKPLISDNQWNVVTSISEGKKMMGFHKTIINKAHKAEVTNTNSEPCNNKLCGTNNFIGP